MIRGKQEQRTGSGFSGFWLQGLGFSLLKGLLKELTFLSISGSQPDGFLDMEVRKNSGLSRCRKHPAYFHENDLVLLVLNQGHTEIPDASLKPGYGLWKHYKDSFRASYH